MQNVITDLSRFMQFNEAESMAFKNILRLKKIKKNEHLLVEGEVCNFGVFIVEGCIRYYYSLDGVESTGNFFFENDWYSDFESFLYGKPSLLNIEALEDCVLYLAYKHDFEKLVAEYPVFNSFLRIMMERTIKGLTGRNMAMSLLSHEERYLRFLKYCPKVVERVSLKYIASYLGIQPESLSRIRTRITLNSKS
ncbi:Crp/Fnr family transcriptional regulator [Flavobacterium tructae]|uniref:Crp/Fnr family transcriptional regulator n=1 Tax=Flavobacterium tructae TaxID=1114873 RepID=UPI0025520B1A|nr:Crp/Fnr family transcriptional regulator [Flavobacterium tructae]MDL2145308.1 Crp/Fnr family transcriptional regulator [Flavobacterium tructae]